MVSEFLQVEDVTLNQTSGGVLNDTNTYYNQINEFLQVEDGTLIQKSGGVLNDKHLLANQLKLSIFYSNWEIQGCLRWHKCTLKTKVDKFFTGERCELNQEM